MSFFNIFKRKKKTIIQADEVIQELGELVNNNDFDNDFIYCHLLNKCIQLSQSEYGFIGEIKFDSVKNEEYLHTYSITNIAWNHASSKFFRKYIDDELRFYNLKKNMFGDTVYSKKSLIINKYNIDRNILPPGHPHIKRFLCIPIVIKDNTKYLIGLCNKRSNYDACDKKAIEKIMTILRILYSSKNIL